MPETEYLLILSKRNLFPLRKNFNELGGFYNGLAYVFPSKSEKLLQDLVQLLPETKIHKLPLGLDQTFEDLRRSYKVYFYQEKLLKVDEKISVLKSQNNAGKAQEELQELMEERERLKDCFEWISILEKTILKNKKDQFDLKFINENKVNYILESAPEMPKLVNYIDEDGKNQPFIRKGITAMLVSPGGLGKTHILVQLGISIAVGCKWLNTYPIENKGSVFIGLGENSEDDIHRLVRKISLNLHSHSDQELSLLKGAGDRISIHSFCGIDATFIQKNQPTDFYYKLLKILKEKEPKDGWSCLILDPISRFLGAHAETDNASATQAIALFENLIQELVGKPTIIFGHHMNKSGLMGIGTDQSAARGSSAITDGVRWQANLEKIRKKNAKDEDEQYEPDEILIRPVKSNFTKVLPPQTLHKDSNGCFYAIHNARKHPSLQILIKRSQIKNRN